MKVLIFGSKGMLGSDLMEVFSEYQPVGVDRDTIDIRDTPAVFSLLEEVVPQVVINASGYTAVDAAEKEGKEEAAAVNGAAVGDLATLCAKRGTPLVHFSTDYVFDGRKRKEGYKEADEPHPINAYGASKFLGEQLLQQATEQFYLIRSSWLFGLHGKNFVTTMLEAAKKGETLKVVNDQIGKPTFTRDLAESTLTLLLEQRPHGIYHIVNEDSLSWYDFAVEIFLEAGVHVDIAPVSSEEYRRAARRPRNSTLVNTKFPPLRSHREALRNYLSLL